MEGSINEDSINTIESSLANNQACNINAVNQDYTPPPSPTGQQGTTTTGGTTRDSTVTDVVLDKWSSNNKVGLVHDGESYTGSDQRNEDGSSSNDPEDNNTLSYNRIGRWWNFIINVDGYNGRWG